MEKHNIIWRHVEIEISFEAEKYGVIDHIELRTKNKEAIPVTDTGYRSHYVSVGTVEHYGGAVAFVTAWLDHEAESTGWSNDQLSFF